MPSDDDQSFEMRVAQRAPGGDVEALLQRVRELIDGARPAALSAQQVKVDRDSWTRRSSACRKRSDRRAG